MRMLPCSTLCCAVTFLYPSRLEVLHSATFGQVEVRVMHCLNRIAEVVPSCLYGLAINNPMPSKNIDLVDRESVRSKCVEEDHFVGHILESRSWYT